MGDGGMKPIVAFLRSDDPLSGEALERLLAHTEEDHYVEFKRELNLKDEKTQLETVKDISAFANGLGGYLVIGAKPSKDEYPGVNDETVKFLDDADNIMSKLNPFIEPHITGIRSTIYKKDGTDYVVVFVPMSLKVTHFISKDGSFKYPSGKSEKKFLSKGSFYVRRSSGNVLGNSRLMDEIFERRLLQHKRFLLENIAKVVEAPTESLVLLASEEKDKYGTSHFIIKDGPDSLPVKGMSLTAIASTQEEAVAQAISLYSNDHNDVPPESTLWRWYRDRRNLVERLSEEHKLAVAKFSLMSDVPVFFWLQDMGKDGIESMLLEVAGWSVETRNIVSDAVHIGAVLGKGAHSKVLNKLGSHKSKLAPRSRKFPASNPRKEFFRVERLERLNILKQDKEQLMIDLETELDHIASMAAQDQKRIGLTEKWRASSYDCYLYAQDKYEK